MTPIVSALLLVLPATAAFHAAPLSGGRLAAVRMQEKEPPKTPSEAPRTSPLATFVVCS
jgi:hypothetical protein